MFRFVRECGVVIQTEGNSRADDLPRLKDI
jgi:hypothetical protein